MAIRLNNNNLKSFIYYVNIIYYINYIQFSLTYLLNNHDPRYDRILCLESQKLDGTYQRYNNYFGQILFIIYKYIIYSVPSIF